MNSARMSMLVWAMYNRRLDGRPNDDSVDESNEVWDVDHPSIEGLTDAERQLIQRWIDLGASGVPEEERTDDMRPVLTVTPLLEESGVVERLLVGLWDDSGIDYSTLAVTANEALGGVPAGDSLLGSVPSGDVVEVRLPEALGADTTNALEFTFEVSDRAWPASDGRANRTRRVLSARWMLERAGVEVERSVPDGGVPPPGDGGVPPRGAGCACVIGERGAPASPPLAAVLAVMAWLRSGRRRRSWRRC